VAITDRCLEQDWRSGTVVPVVTAIQYMETSQLGTLLTGRARASTSHIRTVILYILNRPGHEAAAGDLEVPLTMAGRSAPGSRSTSPTAAIEAH